MTSSPVDPAHPLWINWCLEHFSKAPISWLISVSSGHSWCCHDCQSDFGNVCHYTGMLYSLGCNVNVSATSVASSSSPLPLSPWGEWEEEEEDAKKESKFKKFLRRASWFVGRPILGFLCVSRGGVESQVCTSAMQKRCTREARLLSLLCVCSCRLDTMLV